MDLGMCLNWWAETTRRCPSAGGREARATHSASTQVYLPWLLQNPQTMETFSQGEACCKTSFTKRGPANIQTRKKEVLHCCRHQRSPSGQLHCAVSAVGRHIFGSDGFMEHCMSLEFTRENKRDRCKTGWQPRDSDGQVAEPPEGGIQHSTQTRGTIRV